MDMLQRTKEVCFRIFKVLHSVKSVLSHEYRGQFTTSQHYCVAVNIESLKVNLGGHCSWKFDTPCIHWSSVCVSGMHLPLSHCSHLLSVRSQSVKLLHGDRL